MSRTRYKIYETQYPYFITTSIVNGYPVFSNRIAAEIILEGLTFIQKEKKAALYAYVIMENHIHIIVQSEQLPKHLRAFKSWTARSIIDQFEKNGLALYLNRFRRAKKASHKDSDFQLWQEGIHYKQIAGNSMMIQKIEYIHNNPIKRGFIDQAVDWRYSSARNYYRNDGLIPLTLYEM